MRVCPKCSGSGHLPHFQHVAGGVCFLCGGRGEISGYDERSPEARFSGDEQQNPFFDEPPPAYVAGGTTESPPKPRFPHFVETEADQPGTDPWSTEQGKSFVARMTRQLGMDWRQAREFTKSVIGEEFHTDIAGRTVSIFSPTEVARGRTVFEETFETVKQEAIRQFGRPYLAKSKRTGEEHYGRGLWAYMHSPVMGDVYSRALQYDPYAKEQPEGMLLMGSTWIPREDIAGIPGIAVTDEALVEHGTTASKFAKRAKPFLSDKFLQFEHLPAQRAGIAPQKGEAPMVHFAESAVLLTPGLVPAGQGYYDPLLTGQAWRQRTVSITLPEDIDPDWRPDIELGKEITTRGGYLDIAEGVHGRIASAQKFIPEHVGIDVVRKEMGGREYVNRTLVIEGAAFYPEHAALKGFGAKVGAAAMPGLSHQMSMRAEGEDIDVMQMIEMNEPAQMAYAIAATWNAEVRKKVFGTEDPRWQAGYAEKVWRHVEAEGQIKELEWSQRMFIGTREQKDPYFEALQEKGLVTVQRVREEEGGIFADVTMKGHAYIGQVASLPGVNWMYHSRVVSDEELVKIESQDPERAAAIREYSERYHGEGRHIGGAYLAMQGMAQHYQTVSGQDLISRLPEAQARASIIAEHDIPFELREGVETFGRQAHLLRAVGEMSRGAGIHLPMQELGIDYDDIVMPDPGIALRFFGRGAEVQDQFYGMLTTMPGLLEMVHEYQATPTEELHESIVKTADLYRRQMSEATSSPEMRRRLSSFVSPGLGGQIQAHPGLAPAEAWVPQDRLAGLLREVWHSEEFGGHALREQFRTPEEATIAMLRGEVPMISDPTVIRHPLDEAYQTDLAVRLLTYKEFRQRVGDFSWEDAMGMGTLISTHLPMAHSGDMDIDPYLMRASLRGRRGMLPEMNQRILELAEVGVGQELQDVIGKVMGTRLTKSGVMRTIYDSITQTPIGEIIQGSIDFEKGKSMMGPAYNAFLRALPVLAARNMEIDPEDTDLVVDLYHNIMSEFGAPLYMLAQDAKDMPDSAADILSYLTANIQTRGYYDKRTDGPARLDDYVSQSVRKFHTLMGDIGASPRITAAMFAPVGEAGFERLERLFGQQGPDTPVDIVKHLTGMARSRLEQAGAGTMPSDLQRSVISKSPYLSLLVGYGYARAVEKQEDKEGYIEAFDEWEMGMYRVGSAIRTHHQLLTRGPGARMADLSEHIQNIMEREELGLMAPGEADYVAQQLIQLGIVEGGDVERVVGQLPASFDEVLEQMESIPGIGEKTIRKLKDQFGTRLFDVAIGEPTRLQVIKGIGDVRAQKIHSVASRYSDELTRTFYEMGGEVTEAFARKLEALPFGKTILTQDKRKIQGIRRRKIRSELMEELVGEVPKTAAEEQSLFMQAVDQARRVKAAGGRSAFREVAERVYQMRSQDPVYAEVYEDILHQFGLETSPEGHHRYVDFLARGDKPAPEAFDRELDPTAFVEQYLKEGKFKGVPVNIRADIMSKSRRLMGRYVADTGHILIDPEFTVEQFHEGAFGKPKVADVKAVSKYVKSPEDALKFVLVHEWAHSQETWTTGTESRADIENYANAVALLAMGVPEEQVENEYPNLPETIKDLGRHAKADIDKVSDAPFQIDDDPDQANLISEILRNISSATGSGEAIKKRMEHVVRRAREIPSEYVDEHGTTVYTDTPEPVLRDLSRREALLRDEATRERMQKAVKRVVDADFPLTPEDIESFRDLQKLHRSVLKGVTPYYHRQQRVDELRAQMDELEIQAATHGVEVGPLLKSFKRAIGEAPQNLLTARDAGMRILESIGYGGTPSELKPYIQETATYLAESGEARVREFTRAEEIGLVRDMVRDIEKGDVYETREDLIRAFTVKDSISVPKGYQKMLTRLHEGKSLTGDQRLQYETLMGGESPPPSREEFTQDVARNYLRRIERTVRSGADDIFVSELREAVEESISMRPELAQYQGLFEAEFGGGFLTPSQHRQFAQLMGEPRPLASIEDAEQKLQSVTEQLAEQRQQLLAVSEQSVMSEAQLNAATKHLVDMAKQEASMIMGSTDIHTDPVQAAAVFGGFFGGLGGPGGGGPGDEGVPWQAMGRRFRSLFTPFSPEGAMIRLAGRMATGPYHREGRQAAAQMAMSSIRAAGMLGPAGTPEDTVGMGALVQTGQQQLALARGGIAAQQAWGWVHGPQGVEDLAEMRAVLGPAATGAAVGAFAVPHIATGLGGKGMAIAGLGAGALGAVAGVGLGGAVGLTGMMAYGHSMSERTPSNEMQAYLRSQRMEDRHWTHHLSPARRWYEAQQFFMDASDRVFRGGMGLPDSPAVWDIVPWIADQYRWRSTHQEMAESGGRMFQIPIDQMDPAQVSSTIAGASMQLARGPMGVYGSEAIQGAIVDYMRHMPIDSLGSFLDPESEQAQLMDAMLSRGYSFGQMGDLARSLGGTTGQIGHFARLLTDMPGVRATSTLASASQLAPLAQYGWDARTIFDVAIHQGELDASQMRDFMGVMGYDPQTIRRAVMGEMPMTGGPLDTLYQQMVGREDLLQIDRFGLPIGTTSGLQGMWASMGPDARIAIMGGDRGGVVETLMAQLGHPEDSILNLWGGDSMWELQDLQMAFGRNISQIQRDWAWQDLEFQYGDLREAGVGPATVDQIMSGRFSPRRFTSADQIGGTYQRQRQLNLLGNQLGHARAMGGSVTIGDQDFSFAGSFNLQAAAIGQSLRHFRERHALAGRQMEAQREWQLLTRGWQEADIYQGIDRGRVQMDWQRADMDRSFGRSMIQIGWRMDDALLARDQTRRSDEWQRYNIDWQRNLQLLQRDWTVEDWMTAQQHRQMTRGWQEEDWAIGRMQTQLTRGWQLEDLDEAVRFASGRERERLITQRERAVTMHGIEDRATRTTEDRARTMWEIEDERAETEIQRQEQIWQLEDERHEAQLRYIDEEREAREENWRTQFERLQQQRDWIVEDHQIQIERFEERRDWQEEDWATQLERFREKVQHEDEIHELAVEGHEMQLSHAEESHGLQMAQHEEAVKAFEAEKALQEEIQSLRDEVDTQTINNLIKQKQLADSISEADYAIGLAGHMFGRMAEVRRVRGFENFIELVRVIGKLFGWPYYVDEHYRHTLPEEVKEERR